mmetsp:Transcript_35160/g.80320  ORF Transcript_35160/g.80320 Transcript_35160/m.80320 type:complete len:220 (-) Transcript_35160:309-968(-)
MWRAGFSACTDHQSTGAEVVATLEVIEVHSDRDVPRLDRGLESEVVCRPSYDGTGSLELPDVLGGLLHLCGVPHGPDVGDSRDVQGLVDDLDTFCVKRCDERAIVRRDGHSNVELIVLERDVLTWPKLSEAVLVNVLDVGSDERALLNEAEPDVFRILGPCLALVVIVSIAVPVIVACRPAAALGTPLEGAATCTRQGKHAIGRWRVRRGAYHWSSLGP